MGTIPFVPFDPSVPVRADLPDVLEKLASELSEAAAAARYGGQPELAGGIEDRVDVVRWAQTRDLRPSAPTL